MIDFPKILCVPMDVHFYDTPWGCVGGQIKAILIFWTHFYSTVLFVSYGVCNSPYLSLNITFQPSQY